MGETQGSPPFFWLLTWRVDDLIAALFFGVNPELWCVSLPSDMRYAEHQENLT
jgi:hypothetical protein